MITPLEYTDAYKLSHKGFMDPLTEFIYANLTPRTAKYLGVLKEFYDQKVVVFGPQHFIKDFLIKEFNENFFHQPKEKVINHLRRRLDGFLGKGAISIRHFEELHDLGYLPISIKVIPEGSLVNIGVPIMTIRNTHKKFAWLTNYLETVISCEIWKPVTTATIGREFKKVMDKFADETVGARSHVMFQCHGFEFRGMSGRHDAAICGAGPLLSFYGTDTFPSIGILEDFYNADCEKEFIATSVPATEHMVTSLGTSVKSELEFFREAITKHYPHDIVSMVSDTYDFFKVITEFASKLKPEILARTPKSLPVARVVFRPDSGDPANIVCGDPTALPGTPEFKGAVECLWDIFGGTVSSKGYRTTHDKVGLIYGDSITLPKALEILTRLQNKGFASNNIVFGVGSYTYNLLSRDCLGLAIKGTWAQVDGKGYDLFKAPKTDSGMKKSAKGLLRVDKVGNNYILKDCCTPEEEAGGELKEVFRDGKLLIDYTLKEIRARVDESF